MSADVIANAAETAENAEAQPQQEEVSPDNVTNNQDDSTILGDTKTSIDELNKVNSAGRKGRKRKRHHNAHNKKWSKQFKRQMSQHNNNKADIENMQNAKNLNNRKHLYGQKNLKSIFKNISHRNRGLPKFFLPDKRPRKELIIPPTKFLLGGNISDPLNLNSLQDEALNASMNAATPKTSPITTPPKIEVIIPPNIYDPLHLLDPVDSIEYEKLLISPLKRKFKHRNRKKKPRKRYDSVTTTISIAETVGDDNGDLIINTDDEDKPIEEDKLSVKKRDSIELRKEPLVIEKEKCTRDLRLDLSGECSTGNRKRKNSEGPNSNKNKLRRMDSMDKIVSPVIPQPGAWKRPPLILPMGAPRNRTRVSSTSISEEIGSSLIDEDKIVDGEQIISQTIETVSAIEDIKSTEPTTTLPVFKKENVKYQYGNYNRYYGFNSLDEFMDVRLTIFKRNAFLFRDKDILDVGCNAGHMSIAVARKLHPKSIIGIDICKNSIARARGNLSMYVKIPVSPKVVTTPTDSDAAPKPCDEQLPDKKRTKSHKREKHKVEYFPISFPICYGGIPHIAKVNNDDEQPTDIEKNDNTFPNNVSFRTINYVLTDESQLSADTQQYDLIMCLSVTKWIHLNFGDAGLKMTFKRMFNQLRPGGKLILEAQNWASYKKKKKLTETIFNNYKNIEFFPNKFHEYLLGPEVGFSHSYTLGIPRHLGKGFRRPIQLYLKGDFTPSQIRWSDNYHPQTPFEPYVGYYADMKRPARHVSSVWGGLEATPSTSYGRYCHRYTPSHGLSSTSQYYNPLETDSYLPSYDNEIKNRHYCFASPLYSTVWSPPSGRKSASQTPLFGSIRKINDGDETFVARSHVYLPIGGYDAGRESTRSLDECSRSPQARYIYATASGSSSTRDVDLDCNSPKDHVYATNCDNSSSPIQHYSGDSSRSVEVEPDDNIEECCIENGKNELDQ